MAISSSMQRSSKEESVEFRRLGNYPKYKQMLHKPDEVLLPKEANLGCFTIKNLHSNNHYFTKLYHFSILVFLFWENLFSQN